MKAVVCFSGGQDSTVCLYKAIQENEEVLAVSFDYGQNNFIELDCAKNICKKLDIEHKIVDVNFIADITDSPYVKGMIVEGNSMVNENLPASWIPHRNMMFLTICHAIAIQRNYDFVYTGVNSVDYSGYPDCRSDFLLCLEETFTLSCEKVIAIQAPLIYLTKEQIWAESEKLGILDLIIKDTHTCYNGNHTDLHEWGYGCGECSACVIRKNSYKKFSLNNLK